MKYTSVKVIILWMLVATTIAVPIVQKQQHDNSYYHYDHSGPKEDLDAASQYDYSYSVHSEKTGDIKAHKESKDHDGAVKGVFMFIEPDGHKRTVQYSVYKDSGFIADVQREEVAGYKVPQVKYVKYEEPKKLKQVPVQDYSKFLIKYEDEPKPLVKSAAVAHKQLSTSHLPQYEKQYLTTKLEPVKHEEYSYQQQKHVEVKDKPIYETELKKQPEEAYNGHYQQQLPEFLHQQQPPKYEHVFKQFEIQEELPKYEQYKHVEVSEPPKYKYEQYQIPSEYQESPKEAPIEHQTQYEQENYNTKTAPQQFYPNEYKSQVPYKYEVQQHDHRVTTEHPEVESVKYVTPKYEVKYDHFEFKKEEPPQYQVKYVFVKKPVEQKVSKYEKSEPKEKLTYHEEEEQTKTPNTQIAGPVKQYRFSPLEDLYKFVIYKAKTHNAEPAPKFLQ